MSGYGGVAKIVRFNWPWYALALLVTIGAVTGFATGALPAGAWWPVCVALVLADGWLLLSLLVSHVVYDRSDVVRGGWLGPPPAGPVVVFHLGQDEATALLARRFPTANVRTFDLHDPARSGSPSLRRARAVATTAATPAALDGIPLEDGSIALGVVAFAAHEVRAEAVRIAMFREFARVVAGTGRLLVLEHLRDGWNFLAYGPGVFHFLSRRTWLMTFAAAGFAVRRESRITPWTRCFELARTP